MAPGDLMALCDVARADPFAGHRIAVTERVEREARHAQQDAVPPAKRATTIANGRTDSSPFSA